MTGRSRCRPVALGLDKNAQRCRASWTQFREIQTTFRITAMFSVICTTCEAKIVVKNDALIGQIAACPKCGSMVLIAPPENKPAPVSENSDIAKPSSAIPPVVPPIPEIPPLEIPESLEPPTPPTLPISDVELRTRQIMLITLGSLIVLLCFCLLGFVFLGGPTQEPHDDAVEIATAQPQTPPEPEPPVVPEPPPEQRTTENPEPAEPPSSETLDSDKTSEDALSLPNEVPVTSADEPTPAPTSPQTEKSPPAPGSNDELRERLAELLQIKKEAPVSENVAPRLNLPLRSLRFEKVPLLEVVRTLEALVDVPMTFDLESMRGTGITIDRPMTAALEDATVWEALTRLLEPLGMTATVEERQVTLQVTQRIETRQHDVSDLLRLYLAERIKELCAALVTPVSLTQDGETVNGNTPTMLRFEGNAATDRAVVRLLDTLRIIRDNEPKSSLPRDEIAPETFGWDTVRRPMTLNYIRPVPLTEAFTLLEKVTPLKIVVDHRAIHQAGLTFKELTSTVFCTDGTLDDALTGLLGATDQLPMTYRIINEHLIEVTTPEDARSAEKMSVELHRLVLMGDETAEMFVHQTRTMFAQESQENGAVLMTEAGFLLMRQSQPLQRELRRIIADREIEAEEVKKTPQTVEPPSSD